MLVFMSNLNLYHLKMTLLFLKQRLVQKIKFNNYRRVFKENSLFPSTSGLFFRELDFSPSFFFFVLMVAHPALNTVLRY